MVKTVRNAAQTEAEQGADPAQQAAQPQPSAQPQAPQGAQFHAPQGAQIHAPQGAQPSGAQRDAQRDSMWLWNALRRTDPKATKPFTRSGGFRGTQIDPAWRLQIMTEVFGPVGKGWGYEQLEWTVVERMVFICVRVWYRDPDTGEVCHTGPQWGGTEVVRRNRDGTERPDDECFKMSITDAVGKCLQQLGLGADVYMGQFDDSKYREESEAYWNARSLPENQPPAVEAFEREVKAKLDEVEDLEALDALWRSGIGARAREIGVVDKAAQQRVTSLFSQKKAELLRGERDAA